MVLQWKFRYGQLRETHYCQMCSVGGKGGASSGYIRQIDRRAGFKPMHGIASSPFGANPNNMGGTYVEGLKNALETQCRQDRRTIRCTLTRNPSTSALKTALKSTTDNGSRPVILQVGAGHFIAAHSNYRPGLGKTRVYRVGDPEEGGIEMTVDRTEQTPPVVRSPDWSESYEVSEMLVIR